MQLSKTDIENLISIVASHPTPQGVGSSEGQEKIRLINLLEKLKEKNASAK